MADDAGALLVRSGLVPSSALDDARARVANLGGTLGEHLVFATTISDDALTDFYRSRLLVPQVNPNTLARLPVRVVSTIPSDMAIELRAIPVSLDSDNNLTVAMSDPSDSHAVDEIAFFTGTYVVRAVATQMQIAWCLAHYYGHVTALGQKLLQPSEVEPDQSPTRDPDVPAKIPRVKGHTAKIVAARHRGRLPMTGPLDIPRPNSAVLDDPSIPEAVVASVTPAAAVGDPEPEGPDTNPDPVRDKPRARSISGEIRIPVRRASSIKPPDEDPYGADDDESGPVITIEMNAEEDTSPRKVPVKRRVVKTDPPELAARSGEVDSITGPVTKMDLDGPLIIVDDESPTGADVSGELKVISHRDHAAPATTIEVDDTSVGVVIHEHPKLDSEPVALDRKRTAVQGPATLVGIAPPDEGEEDDGEVVILEVKKPAPRPEKKTQVGMVAEAVSPRTHRDTEAGEPPEDFTGPTRLDAMAIPDGEEFSDEIVAPPPPEHDADTSPHILPPSLSTLSRADTDPPRRPTPLPRATSEDEDGGRVTMVMSAVELDEAVPDRAEVVPAHLATNGRSPSANRKVDYDPVDDGWGPPGTTIPPPLLGAVPGSSDGDDDGGQIPVTNVDNAPLLVAVPSPPELARGAPLVDASAPSLVRALEESTSRSIEVIHALERAQSRDDVISLMSTHLSQTHRRAGFFSIKGGELILFSSLPKSELQTGTALPLDRPSTLQDVVGTRLPYRGPMHDDASRQFLTASLGTCPPEILLVPVVVRERVVGVLFGEHRLLHTFDDQLALAARAAGMALERILKQKRS